MSPFEGVLSFILGLLLFLVVIGPSVLTPSNIAWLTTGDAPQHYLGWAFFRHSDWTLPLGLNPNYGLDFSSKIVFSDSIPWFAIFFKSLAPILPETFQYFGIWLLTCLVLQSYFAWKLLALITPLISLRALGAAFFVIAPPMLGRITADITNTAHMSLVGHFLILAALYGFLRPEAERTSRYWIILMAIAVGVHAYLLAMILAFWGTDILRATLLRRISLFKALGEFIVAVAIIIGIAWLVGYFYGSSPRNVGFGAFTANVFTFFDASDWSHFSPNLPENPYNYEGFAFLGTGIIALLFVAVIALALNRKITFSMSSWQRFIWLPIIALTAFAVSHQIFYGQQALAFPLPEKVLNLASIFRSSGRMIWPVYYLVILTIFYLSIKLTPSQITKALFTICLAVQIADTSAGWTRAFVTLKTEPSSSWPSDLKDPFWAEAATKYQKIRIIMPVAFPLNWKGIAHLAAKNNMGTDYAYLARPNLKVLEKMVEQHKQMLLTGRYEDDTLYILDKDWVQLARDNIDLNEDAIGVVEGRVVIAPNWSKCTDCRSELNFR